MTTLHRAGAGAAALACTLGACGTPGFDLAGGSLSTAGTTAAVTVDSLFANADGVMFANGRVWFRRTGPRATGPYRIVTVNRP